MVIEYKKKESLLNVLLNNLEIIKIFSSNCFFRNEKGILIYQYAVEFILEAHFDEIVDFRLTFQPWQISLRTIRRCLALTMQL